MSLYQLVLHSTRTPTLKIQLSELDQLRQACRDPKEQRPTIRAIRVERTDPSVDLLFDFDDV